MKIHGFEERGDVACDRSTLTTTDIIERQINFQRNWLYLKIDIHICRFADAMQNFYKYLFLTQFHRLRRKIFIWSRSSHICFPCNFVPNWINEFVSNRSLMSNIIYICNILTEKNHDIWIHESLSWKCTFWFWARYFVRSHYKEWSNHRENSVLSFHDGWFLV